MTILERWARAEIVPVLDCTRAEIVPVLDCTRAEIVPTSKFLRLLILIKINSDSHYHSNHFEKFLAHVLSWVKSYHHAEFQRNPPTGLAGMMVKTYRQTNRQILFISQTCHLA